MANPMSLGTNSVTVYIPSIGPGQFQVKEVKIHDGRTVATYQLEVDHRASPLWWITRQSPLWLVASTLVWTNSAGRTGKRGTREWVSVEMNVNHGGLLLDAELGVWGGDAFVNELKRQARLILQWAQPIQEYVDELLDSMGIGTENLQHWDITPIMAKLSRKRKHDPKDLHS